MKFTSNAGKIASSLYNIIGIVNKKSPIKGFSNVKIILNDNFLELLTTDSEISIAETLEVDGLENGQIFIDATMFYDAVRKMKSDYTLSFSIIKNRFSITNGSVKFLIPFVVEDCFSNISEENKKVSVVISSCDAIKFFEKTKNAIALENTRINLTGLFLHSLDGLLCAAATDCNRLAYFRSDISIEYDLKTIIPRKTVMELNKLIVKLKSKEIYISFHGHEEITRIVFHIAKIKIVSKLIVGQFPNYHKVIPLNAKIVLIINTKILIEVVERVSIVASEKNRAIKFHISDNQLRVYMSNIDSGFGEETINLDNFYCEEELEIAINYNYLLESLYPIDGEFVKIKIIDSKSAIIIEDSKNNSIGYVIMPMIG